MELHWDKVIQLDIPNRYIKNLLVLDKYANKKLIIYFGLIKMMLFDDMLSMCIHHLHMNMVVLVKCIHSEWFEYFVNWYQNHITANQAKWMNAKILFNLFECLLMENNYPWSR